MLLTHLTIEKAVEVIRHKRDESVTLDWLLQCAHEGEIELLALVREPVYFIERVDVPVNWTEIFGQSSGLKTKAEARPTGSPWSGDGTTSKGVARPKSDFPEVRRISQLYLENRSSHLIVAQGVNPSLKRSCQSPRLRPRMHPIRQ